MPGDLLRLAEEIGFSHYAELNMNALIARSEIRDMCITGKCQRYGKSWSCPPACGSLETCAARMRQYSSGILVQTTALIDRKSTRLNSSHPTTSRMPSSA